MGATREGRGPRVDYPVAAQRPRRLDDLLDGLIELPCELGERRRRSPAQRAHDPATNLPEGSVVRGLSPARSNRRRSTSTEGTDPGEGAPVASRGRPAHLAPEIHQRLVPAARIRSIDPCRRCLVHSGRPRTVGAQTNAAHDPSDVRVDRRDHRTERDRCHRGRRVRPYSRERTERVGVRREAAIVTSEKLARRGVQRDGPPVVTEGPPSSEHVRPGRGRESPDVREHIDEPLEGRSDPRGLRLLQHDLADQHPVWIGVFPPRVPPRAGPVPVEQRVFHGSRLAG